VAALGHNAGVEELICAEVIWWVIRRRGSLDGWAIDTCTRHIKSPTRRPGEPDMDDRRANQMITIESDRHGSIILAPG
jgi:hypothetical protein